MEQITLRNPSKLVFGKGCLAQFAQDYGDQGYTRMLLVTIPPVREQIEPLLKYLNAKGVEIEIDETIVAEPSFDDFELLLNRARNFEADSVVGIGGGSALDTAKLIAAQLRNDQTTDQIKGIGNLKERKTYLACIPTTSGTGSEVSPNALFVDNSGQKIGVISPFLVPDAAYIDPELTISLPSALTAATGIDALTHCLEAYTNKFSHPIVDLYALEGIKIINKHLKEACTNGNNIEARTNVALGSVYGGMCLGPVNTAAVHALAYPLGVQYQIPHGLSNALLLPYVMEFNIEYDPSKYAVIAEALGAQKKGNTKDTALEAVRIIKDLIKDCGLPNSLEEVGVEKDAIKMLAEDAIKVTRLLNNNNRPVSIKDAENIYSAAF